MKIIKEDNVRQEFKEVRVRRPLMNDYHLAQLIAPDLESIKYTAALLSRVATFDGKKLSAEEIMENVEFAELRSLVAAARLDAGNLPAAEPPQPSSPSANTEA